MAVKTFKLRVLGASVLLAASLGLSGCESLFGESAPDLNKDAANYSERAVERIYADAWKQIDNENWENAAKQFEEVERQHPYSPWARRATLMAAYCYYMASTPATYALAISTADNYIALHPGSDEVPYAFYLKAISIYEQVIDVTRDQSTTEAALVALQDVVQRFPDTEYARDANLKIDLTMDHLAAKEMSIGRYYLMRGDYISAINRFKVVVTEYQRTPQIAEALERLTEAYYALGVYNEAKAAAAVLGANYPGSAWYQDAYNLLQNRNLKPESSGDSWISKAFNIL
jgi:outer membrane protein assembly factor BamD